MGLEVCCFGLQLWVFGVMGVVEEVGLLLCAWFSGQFS